MLQFNREYVDNENYISQIINSANEILDKRTKLYNRVIKTSGIPIERYVTTVATSYFAGKTPEINVKKETNKDKTALIKKLFDKALGKGESQDEFKLMLDYINDYNDLPQTIYQLVKDYHDTGACYWLSYETNENETVFARLNPLQCVALYDYSIPTQLIGGLRIYTEKDKNGNDQTIAILTTDKEKRTYINGSKTSKEFKEDTSQRKDVKWKLTPFYAIENPDGLSIFEPVIDLVDSLEQVIRNERNTFQYNDDAKLKITGYSPMNPLMDEKGQPNQDRIKEDNAVLNAKVFYTPEDGDIDWIIKNVNDTAVQNYTKQLIDFIFMLALIPNMNDISFSNSDSGKAIEQKFFGLEMVLIETEKLFKKELLRMYENITDRINTKKNTCYDFREIDIRFSRNLPISKADITSMWLQLKDLISDKTIIQNLPLELDAETEIANREEQSEENMEDAINRAKQFGKKKEETTEEVGE